MATLKNDTLSFAYYISGSRSLLLLLLRHFSSVFLCDPIDGSPPGSPVPGILQATTLEWVAISFSNAWKWKVEVKSLSHVQLLATPWTAAYQAPPSMGFSRQEYWSGVPLLCTPSTVLKQQLQNKQGPKEMGKEKNVIYFLKYTERMFSLLLPWEPRWLPFL